MKTLKFKPHLVEQILAGTKTSTWRLFDDKDIQIGDVIEVFNKNNGDQFGVVTITQVRVKTLGTLEESDWEGHDRYESDEAMYAEFRSYYGDSVGPDTEVKLIDFTFEEKRYSKVVVVDENDNVIGAEYVRIAVEKGLTRRASRVYVFNESGKLLIQQRSTKVAKPLLLETSAAGHVDQGETYEEAAERELFEELGLRGIELQLVASSLPTPGFFCSVYKAVISDDTEIIFDPEEVAQIIWYDPEVLTLEMAANPELFTISIRAVWSQLKDKLVQAS